MAGVEVEIHHQRNIHNAGQVYGSFKSQPFPHGASFFFAFKIFD
jgi:hypothetical protein